MRPTARQSLGTIVVAILMLVAVLASACTNRVGFSPQQATAGSTATTATDTTDDSAAQQDLVPPPQHQLYPTVTPTPTATPLPLPTPTHVPVPAGVPPAPLASGYVILVSLNAQQLWAYHDGAYAFTALVETGRPELPTPTGTFHVFYKQCSDLRWTSNAAPTSQHNPYCQHNGDGYQFVFNSPWPPGSPYYYYPTHINYAAEFLSGGFYLHDAWWHVKFGPGSNVPHQLSNGTWETGSHGCIGMPIADAERLYAWAPNGTTVIVRA
jgi:lipoprotein-anchoring transpeptidase ErfK/SrfK